MRSAQANRQRYLNGYLGGSRTHDLQGVDFEQLGLSEAGRRVLLKSARRVS